MLDNFEEILNLKISHIMEKYKDVDDKNDYEFDFEKNQILKEQNYNQKNKEFCKSEKERKKIKKINKLKNGLKEYKDLYELVFGHE